MIHMLGETWMELFDVVVTSARKPSFYLRTDRSVGHVFIRRFRFPDLHLFKINIFCPSKQLTELCFASYTLIFKTNAPLKVY